MNILFFFCYSFEMFKKIISYGLEISEGEPFVHWLVSSYKFKDAMQLFKLHIGFIDKWIVIFDVFEWICNKYVDALFVCTV